MPVRTAVLLALTILAAATPSAIAAIPPEDDPPGGNDSNKNHVYKLKPWKAKFEYRIVRDARTYDELNARSDVSANVVKRQWFGIDCQLTNTTQNGQVLWNHIPNVGWIADHNMKTYTDGRLEGAPTCAVPGPNHVWFQQPWLREKEYRATRHVAALDKPGGAPVGKGFNEGDWLPITCKLRAANGKPWVQVYFNPFGAGYIRADALRFWQAGYPDGLPACAQEPEPVRTWVAMGDSYAAGQGANDYSTSSGNCRQSANAYWALLRGHLTYGLTSPDDKFVACSGATTSSVRADQLSALDSSTRLITISVGGNDMHFKDVLTGCVTAFGNSCKEEVDSHFSDGDLKSLRSKLSDLYRDIRLRATKATVLVLGYPELVPRDHVDGCGAMSDGDAPYLHAAAEKINATIRSAVGNRHGFRFVGLVKTFLAHPGCNDDAADWINGVVASDRQESFHPNEAGHRAIAARLAAAVPRFFR